MYFKAAIVIVVIICMVGISLGDALGNTIQHHMVTRLLSN